MTNVIHIQLNNKGLPFLEFIFIIGMMGLYLNDDLYRQFSLIAPFIMLGYIIYFLFQEPNLRASVAFFILLIFLLTLFYLLLNDSSSIGNVENREIKRFYSKFSQYLFMFFPLLLFYRTIHNVSKKQFYAIVIASIILITLLMQTIVKIAENDEFLLHSMNLDVLEQADIKFQGFAYIYSFTFLIILCTECIRFSTNRYIKLIGCILLPFSLQMLLLGQFALSIITTTLSLIFLYYISTHKGWKRIFIISCMLILLLLFPLIIKLFINYSNSELLNARLQELYNSWTGQPTHADTDLNARLTLYGRCLQDFITSPIWGHRYLPYNGHSTFLTVLADLGLLGGTVVYQLFSRSIKFMKNQLHERFTYYLPLLCQIILMGLTNPIHSSPSNFMMLFYICPLFIVAFLPNKIESHE